jgi:hypothetical protein
VIVDPPAEPEHNRFPPTVSAVTERAHEFENLAPGRERTTGPRFVGLHGVHVFALGGGVVSLARPPAKRLSAKKSEKFG